MKKAIPFLCLIFLFFQCKEKGMMDDIDTSELSPFEVEVSDYFYKEVTNYTQTGSIYLTDKDGAKLAKADLINTSSVILNADFDNSDNRVDATFVLEWDYGTSLVYTIQTFVDVDPAEISLQGEQEVSSSGGQAKVVIQNTGGDIGDVFFSTGGYSGTSGSIGTAVYEYYINQTPDNVLMTFKRNNQNFGRYLWLEGVTGISVDTFNHDDIPMLETVTRDYPANDKIRIDMSATRADDPHRAYYIFSHTDDNGAASNELRFPGGIFDQFQIYTTVTMGNRRYWTEEKENTVAATYQLPDLDFQVDGSTMDDLQVTTASTYDYYTFVFYADNLAGNHRVTWEVIGKSQASLQVALPNLIDEVFTAHPDFSQSDLDFNNFRIEKVQGISSYRDYITATIDNHSDERKSITGTNSVSGQ